MKSTVVEEEKTHKTDQLSAIGDQRSAFSHQLSASSDQLSVISSQLAVRSRFSTGGELAWNFGASA